MADREILFTLETNEELAMIRGRGPNSRKPKPQRKHGIKNVQWTTAFIPHPPPLDGRGEVALPQRQPALSGHASRWRPGRIENLQLRLRAKYPHHEIERSAPILHSIRIGGEELWKSTKCNARATSPRRALTAMAIREARRHGIRNRSGLRPTSIPGGAMVGRFWRTRPDHGSGFNACVLHRHRGWTNARPGTSS